MLPRKWNTFRSEWQQCFQEVRPTFHTVWNCILHSSTIRRFHTVWRQHSFQERRPHPEAKPALPQAALTHRPLRTFEQSLSNLPNLPSCSQNCDTCESTLLMNVKLWWLNNMAEMKCLLCKTFITLWLWFTKVIDLRHLQTSCEFKTLCREIIVLSFKSIDAARDNAPLQRCRRSVCRARHS